MAADLRPVAPVLRAQHSLITRRQAVAHGLTPGEVDHVIATGIWEVLERGLYGPIGVAWPWPRQLMAATLVAPAGSFISHRAGAHLRGVGGLHDPRPEITIPRGRKLRRDWLITHESIDLHLADVDTIDGIPVTGPYRLAMDLGAVVSTARYNQTLRELRHGHGVESRELLRTYLRHKRQGRNGGGALRDWLDRYFTIDGTPESGAELVVLDAILDARLPAPAVQHWVEVDGARYRLDLAYPDHLIDVEVDGAQHDDVDVRADDAVRTKRLKAAGWDVHRVRAKKLATDLPALLATLHRILRPFS